MLAGGAGEELVDEQAAQALRAAAVAGEERSGGDLREVREREDRAVEVGHVRRETLLLLGREGLDVVVRDHRRNSTDRRGRAIDGGAVCDLVYNPGPMAGAAVPTPRFLADVYEAASECNKCSLCQATCPAYVVNPVEWETARGRIALIRDAMEGRLELSDIAEGPLSSCLTCDNCVAACAPRVPTGHIVSRARQELHAQEGYPWGQSFALRTRAAAAGCTPRAPRLRALHEAHGALRARRAGSDCSRGWGPSEPSPSRAGRRPTRPCTRCSRDLPPVAEPVRGSVAVLVCCLSNLTVPEATDATIRVLLASGYDVQVPQLGCSGLPARTLGDRDAMIDMAIRNSATMTNLDVDAYIGDTASCTEHYREYGSIAGDDRQVGARARDVAHHTALASDFLDRNGVRGDLGPLRWRVAIDEPCALPIDGPERGAMLPPAREDPASRDRPAQRACHVLRRSGHVFRP